MNLKKVFFTWDITYKCNYNCIYCDYGGAKGDRQFESTVYPGVDKLINIWHNIYKKYGSCHIHFAGGEPFHYPDFFKLIENISKLHTWECSTNLSWEPEVLISKVNSGKARIGVSFHPEFVDFETFLNKAIKLKKAGFEVWSNFVPHPIFISKTAEYKKEFDKNGIIMSILPFKGKYKGKVYPEGYSNEERLFLKDLGKDPWIQKTIDFTFNKEKENYNEEKLCRMGQIYAKIYPNGDVFNCCSKSAIKLGNLFDGTFSLLTQPYKCKEVNCPCWKRMLVDNEEFWIDHWVVPPDGR